MVVNEFRATNSLPTGSSIIDPSTPSTAFDTWLEKHRIAGLVLEAVQNGFQRWPDRDFHYDGGVEAAEKMMALITYCYAMGAYDSEDIVATLRRDPILQQLCGELRPTADTVRRFRWRNSGAIICTLANVFERAHPTTTPNPGRLSRGQLQPSQRLERGL